MVVKIYLTLDLDQDEYPVPADGDVTKELQQAIEEYIYEIDWLKIKHCEITMEK